MAKITELGKKDQQALEATKAIMQKHLKIAEAVRENNIKRMDEPATRDRAMILIDQAELNNNQIDQLIGGIAQINWLLGYIDRFGEA